VAKAFIAHSEVDYLDRMNTDALFREIHFSSDAAFNPGSGALRNLLGRLDFLVVMDASDTSSARIRLIDVESGAVKAIGTCTKHWSLGLGAAAPPDCVAPFVTQSIAASRAKRQMKLERQKQQTTAQEQAQKQQMHAAALAKAEKQAQEKAEAAAQAAAAEQAAEAARQQAEIDRQLAEIKPTLDDLSSRLTPQLLFWQAMSHQLAASGQSLRGSVQSLLGRAKADETNCNNFLASRDPEGLRSCVASWQKDVEKLEALRD